MHRFEDLNRHYMKSAMFCQMELQLICRPVLVNFIIHSSYVVGHQITSQMAILNKAQVVKSRIANNTETGSKLTVHQSIVAIPK